MEYLLDGKAVAQATKQQNIEASNTLKQSGVTPQIAIVRVHEKRSKAPEQ